MARPTLSIVIPFLNEEAVIPELDKRLRAMLKTLDVSWEVVFVDDGSTDSSLSRVQALSASEPRYKVLSLSRNFGHQVAVTAGLDHAAGEAVVVMDADLQDPPEIVAEMLAKFREGFDVVYAVRTKREGEGVFKRATAAVFYRLMRMMVGIDLPVDAGDFRLTSRRVVLALRALRETHRFVRGFVVWVGFKQTSVRYVRPGRFAGETKYPLARMLRFAIDGITSFSGAPLKLATYVGLATSLLAFVAALWVLGKALVFGDPVRGYPSLMVVVLFLGGMQLMALGVIGEYLGRLYVEAKQRPLYLVDEYHPPRG